MKKALWLPGLFAAAAMAGCATATIPSEQLVESQSAIRAAEEMGAQQVPTAALHLKLAREQTQMAQQLIEEEEYKEAELLLKRAEVDAELAIALAHELQARQEAQRALEQVRGLMPQ